MPPAGFEPAVPASDRPQTLALDRSATGIGRFDPRTVQPVTSRYTNWATPARICQAVSDLFWNIYAYCTGCMFTDLHAQHFSELCHRVSSSPAS